MLPHSVFALLHDHGGQVLLIRRRAAGLLSLPGGVVRSGQSLDELLTTYCQRQLGVAPDFDLNFNVFTLAGKAIATGLAGIPHARGAARGRTEAVFWMHPRQLPPEVDPIARYAIAIDTNAVKAHASKAAATVVPAGAHMFA